LLPTVVLLIGLIQLLTPSLTRSGLWFSVTVPPDFRRTSEGRRILRTYRIWVTVHSLVALGLVVLGLGIQRAPPLAIGVFWQVLGSTAAFLSAHARVLAHSVAPSSIREAALVRSSRLPGGPLLQAGPFAVIAIAAVWLRLHWDELPAKIPVHWGADGNPNGWVNHTPLAVYSSLAIGFVLCMAALLLSYGILTRSRRVRATGALVGFLGVLFFLDDRVVSAARVALVVCVVLAESNAYRDVVRQIESKDRHAQKFHRDVVRQIEAERGPDHVLHPEIEDHRRVGRKDQSRNSGPS